MTGWRGNGRLLAPLLFVLPWLVVAAWSGPTRAQDDFDDNPDDNPDEASAEADSLDGGPPGESPIERAIRESALQATSLTGPFFVGLTHTPKAGAKANVRQNTYYGELNNKLDMRAGASFTNTLNWSWEEYRKQNKNVERRDEKFTYQPGQTLPLTMRLDGSWAWSRDNTVNTAGYSNLFAQESKSLRLTGNRYKLATGALTHSFRFGGSVNDQQSENQNTANNSLEADANAGLQTGLALAPGLVLAGRIHGEAGSGNRTLGQKDSPSSSQGDSLGVGLYYQQSFATGRVAVTRANFQKKYLDFKKNSNGLVDTLGVSPDEKIIDELETRDAMSFELESLLNLGPATFKATLVRTGDESDFAVNGQGLRERQMDEMRLASGVRVGVDSLAVGYQYGWKWDDQRIQNATRSRGRQYNKSRDLDLEWMRPFFRGTDFRLRYHEGLSQDIAQFVHNQNDKDRLQTDFSLELGRTWPQVFRTKMVYAYRQSQDLSIRATSSSNNNVKDSYEITPAYTWYVAPWMTWDQSYRVFIQYTNYVYSGLESVSRDDNYNKRGNLTTKVTLYPTKRLEVVLRHDHNKRFNATKSGTDAAGSSFYNRDLNQTIGKLDVGVSFKAMPGVTLEAATYRTRDERTSFGRVDTETTDFSGELWVGTKVNRTWRQSITLSAVVKKFSAFGPSVTETSADYWEADVWLKWGF